jgi:hypothetical protein
MTLIGAILIALGPLADICLGLVGLSGPAEWAWELAGDLTGALIFLVGLNLLVIGLITRL